MNSENVRQVISDAIRKYDGSPYEAIKIAQAAIDKAYVETKLKDSKTGRISYRRPGFMCSCHPSNVGFLNLGNGAVFCDSCGRSIYVEACCEHCGCIFDPEVDPCKHHVCRDCLPGVVAEKRQDYEMWKNNYFDITGEEARDGE